MTAHRSRMSTAARDSTCPILATFARPSPLAPRYIMGANPLGFPPTARGRPTTRVRPHYARDTTLLPAIITMLLMFGTENF